MGENAISAVTKILKYNNSAIHVDEILSHWVTWLPVWEDEDEAPHIYNYLCDLVEAFHREVLKPESEVYRRMLNIVRQVQGNQGVLEACVSQMTVEQQQALQKVLT